MFVKVHKPHALPGGDNKGGCSRLVDYLEKENEDKIETDKEGFFDHLSDAILKDVVISKIDSNNKNLGKNDNKFFMLTVNPSQRELKHLIQRTSGKDVESLSELSKEDRSKLMLELKNYTRGAMDVYAGNFGRDNVNSGSDLVYFAKVETVREYKHVDPLVKENKAISFEIFQLKNKIDALNKHGKASEVGAIEKNIRDLASQYHRQGEEIIKTGLKKEGLQLHVHVVVSRNNVTQKTKLSPLSTSKGGLRKLNGKDVMEGFNHEKFKEDVNTLFASNYQYQSNKKEQYNAKNTSSLVGELGADIGQKVKGKAKSTLKNELLQGHLAEERKVLNRTQDLVQLVRNPKQKALSLVKQKFLEIIKGAGMERG